MKNNLYIIIEETLNKYADGLRMSGKTKEADAVRKSIPHLIRTLTEQEKQ